MTVWADDMKRAAMADAATVCKQADRIAELEAALARLLREMRGMAERSDLVCDDEAEAMVEAGRVLGIDAASSEPAEQVTPFTPEALAKLRAIADAMEVRNVWLDHRGRE